MHSVVTISKASPASSCSVSKSASINSISRLKCPNLRSTFCVKQASTRCMARVRLSVRSSSHWRILCRSNCSQASSCRDQPLRWTHEAERLCSHRKRAETTTRSHGRSSTPRAPARSPRSRASTSRSETTMTATRRLKTMIACCKRSTASARALPVA